MTENNAENENASTAEAAANAEANANADANTSTDDSMKNEAERLRNKTNRTEAEKAAFTLKKNADRVRELGGNPAEILGVGETATSADDDDAKPLTRGDLRKMQAEQAQKSAVELASTAISDEHEREVVLHHLNHTIKPSGNADEDLRNARALANSARNTKLIEETRRATDARQHASATGAPGKTEDAFTPTPEEQAFMRPPFNMSKEKVLAARKAEQAQKA